MMMASTVFLIVIPFAVRRHLSVKVTPGAAATVLMRRKPSLIRSKFATVICGNFAIARMRSPSLAIFPPTITRESLYGGAFVDRHIHIDALHVPGRRADYPGERHMHIALSFVQRTNLIFEKDAKSVFGIGLSEGYLGDLVMEVLRADNLAAAVKRHVGNGGQPARGVKSISNWPGATAATRPATFTYAAFACASWPDTFRSHAQRGRSPFFVPGILR